jgi:hypothetical protein
METQVTTLASLCTQSDLGIHKAPPTGLAPSPAPSLSNTQPGIFHVLSFKPVSSSNVSFAAPALTGVPISDAYAATHVPRHHRSSSGVLHSQLRTVELTAPTPTIHAQLSLTSSLPREVSGRETKIEKKKKTRLLQTENELRKKNCSKGKSTGYEEEMRRK